MEDDVFFIATASQKRLVIWEAQEVNTQIDPERIETHTTREDLRDFSTKVSLAGRFSGDQNGNEEHVVATPGG